MTESMIGGTLGRDVVVVDASRIPPDGQVRKLQPKIGLT
jgi:hypothetical protein